MPNRFDIPPTITSLIDERAATQPDKPWMTIASAGPSPWTWRKINYGELAKVVNNAARWIDEKIGKGVDRPTVAYIG